MTITDKYYKVLDDGFIALKDVMGGDEEIEQAARVSYGKGTRKTNETRGLLRYLMRHRHTTPFEMVELKFHVRVPMDCWRQWIRHRTASVNEYSTRYSEAIAAKQTTLPGEWRLQADSNKQGSGDFVTEWSQSYKDVGVNEAFSPGEHLTDTEKRLHKLSKTVYDSRIDLGVAREQARKDLPLSTYTEAYWKIDLHNLFHFLSLRCDSHAQLEIRSYANIMAGIVKEVCPLAFEGWYDYSFCSSPFSRIDKALLRHEMSLIEDYYQTPDYTAQTMEEYAEELGISNRELQEFFEKTKIPAHQDFSLEGKELYDHKA